MTLQVALLGRAQGLVKENLGRVDLGRLGLDFIGLAAAHKQGRIWRLTLAGQSRHRGQARGAGQLRELFELGIEMGQPQVHPNEQRVGRGGGCGIDQDSVGSAPSAALKFTARPGTMVEMACL